MKAKSEASQLRNMELKYCERCGNIWLRRAGSERTNAHRARRRKLRFCLDGPVSFLQLWTRLRAEVQA